jgi:hypothetical protein
LYRLIITLLNRLVLGPWAICDVVKIHPSFPRYSGELTTRLTWAWTRGSRSLAKSTRCVAYGLDNHTYNLSKFSLDIRKLHTHFFWTVLGNTKSILWFALDIDPETCVLLIDQYDFLSLHISLKRKSKTCTW